MMQVAIAQNGVASERRYQTIKQELSIAYPRSATARRSSAQAGPSGDRRWRAHQNAQRHCSDTKDRLLIVSVGTGHFRAREDRIAFVPGQRLAWARSLPGRLLFMQAIRVLQGMIGDGSAHALRSLQGLGYTPQQYPVDSEIGDMGNELLGTEPLFTAIRYDLDLDQVAHAGVIGERQARALRRLDAPEHMPALWQLASEVARDAVNAAHLQKFGATVVNSAGEFDESFPRIGSCS